jgi:UDP:flavonoid glycosyltransferase YjiC (YdhE family)
VRILFAAWPAYGHLLPMVPLIRAAQRGGHDVVVTSGADVTDVIDRLGVTAHRSGVTLAESYARLPNDVVISELPVEEQADFAARQLFGAGGRDRARDVLELLQTWRPDLVVHDMMELGSAAAAESAVIPHAVHGYGPMIPGAADFASAIGSAMADGGLVDPVAAVFDSPYLDICPPGLRGTGPMPWRAVMPLRPSAGEIDRETELPPELASLPHPDTVYVTLGTIMNQAPDVFRSVIDGAARLPVNLLVTTGPGFDPALLGPVPEAVVTAPFLPQAAVLPLCRAVVSHAGAGTLLGALCHGLPQLCLPQSTDQPFNAAALLPTGAALALQPSEITPDAVAAGLEQLLVEPSFRQAAERLQDEIDAMPTADAVLDEILSATHA